MLRFTIRDVLWLMVVVGLACALISSHHKCNRLEAEPARLEKVLQVQDRYTKSVLASHRQDLRAFQDELQRVSGKRLEWWHYSASGVIPDERKYTFKYADDELNSN